MVLSKDKLDAAVIATADPRQANPAYKAPEPPVKPLSESVIQDCCMECWESLY